MRWETTEIAIGIKEEVVLGRIISDKRGKVVSIGNGSL